MTDQLDEWRELYQTGDKEALTRCLDVCMTFKLPIPEWAAKAFCEAYHKIRTYQVESWDDEFGRPLKKGKRLATARRNVEIWVPLFREIVKRHRAGDAINKGLFSEVGAKFGVSGTVASDIYYEIPEDIREIEESRMDMEETSGKT